MKLVLLSGGSGKRLWPLSNDARSKQFLKVLENERGEMESMVQRVWGQIKGAGLADSAVIATSKVQVEILQNQLGGVPIIVEPERRDTFPAIALAASYLYAQGVSLDETVCILPVDPYVDDLFFDRIRDLEGALHNSGAKMALMGVNPTYPSSKYGYIVPTSEGDGSGYKTVGRFTEKPSEDQAERLIEQGALWNCGVFAFKLGYMMDTLLREGMPIQYEELLARYASLEKISFDYAVVEKEPHIAVIPYDGYWKDLGTWNTLTENMGLERIGKGTLSDDSSNTHLINELDIPVTIIGISDAIVAVSPDGILVSDKAASPRVKDMVKAGQRPMYEERRWGWYRVLDYTKFDDGTEVLTKRIGLGAGKNLGYRKHMHRTDVWTIISGEGTLVKEGTITPVKAGDVVTIEPGTYHCLKASQDIEYIEVQKGIVVQEEDFEEMFSSWQDIESHCSGREAKVAGAGQSAR
ncbi:sugar phosphate nucleotidyltransferase [Saccharibacillus kuerlensis]|uniref:Mannose-1-phosphate guanylyltransferase n=1 Tax=Saccharibacillus kuerlensis TaxID=459527 RepID=A0ABQ2LAD0_9BACL|nr:sugar phosphate nucleotidyltransferase [Saccharibacillus kuerlensis]GGO06390.1 mannose-1-phosphate guanylyltransferase [Saccharibacillus kuerlensis]